jgi:hypothetical protein
MKIHAIQTGTVALTNSWREGVGQGKRRLLHAPRYLPAHDPETAVRLAERRPIGAVRERAVA